jgi:hypothetical protein
MTISFNIIKRLHYCDQPEVTFSLQIIKSQEQLAARIILQMQQL